MINISFYSFGAGKSKLVDSFVSKNKVFHASRTEKMSFFKGFFSSKESSSSSSLGGEERKISIHANKGPVDPLVKASKEQEILKQLSKQSETRKFHGKRSKKLKFVCVSDTHNQHFGLDIPNGDVLIHSGDFIGRGDLEEYENFAKWISQLPHTHKIVIAGNHDELFEKAPEQAQKILAPHCTYLQDSFVVVDGIKIYGSPWQPEFCDWAFNLQRGKEIKEKWDLIEKDTDVLITHGPPHGNRGGICRDGFDAGCEELLKSIKKIKPIVHISGHIHEGYGVVSDEYCTYINASTCTLRYQPTNPPFVFEL
eukprot:TRINITY_DN2925_c0_g1_i1.p1 TRINITY_DN2925_c0_g1~~TRINITY_DN2925_c0_g1_i1.p1  ORF type:complete len:310 (-),score=79.25 TRINITY_DN2925_c0_g1_i1:28-957(-)